jgi:hypothetical protein
VYWDEALTQPAVQPIRTAGGYPVNAGTPARLYTASSYSILVQDRNGITVYSAQSETALSSSDAMTFLQAGTGAVARTAQEKMRDVVSVKDFGAVGNGAADDTAAIQAAITAVFAAGGGTLYFPPGTYLVTGLVLDWGTAETSIRFVGAGKNATVIQKTGASFNAVFALSATLGDGSYSEFSDMHVKGSASCDCFLTTNLARNVWRSVKASGGDVGIENLGSLINTFYDCDLLSNTVGYRARKNAGVFCNLVEFFGGSVRANSQWGFDIGDTNGLHLYGVDIESNGTAGGIGGGFITRSTCDDEIGYSNISINGSWFEGNYGTSIFSEACSGLKLAVRDTPIIASEAGAAVTVGAIGTLSLERITAASAGDTVNASAIGLVIRNCTIYTLTNSSQIHVLESVVTNAGTTQYQQKTAAGTVDITGPGIRSASGSVSAPNSTATTIFAPAGSGGLYEVFVCILSLGSGTTYMSTARVGWDAAAPGLLVANNGSNMSITVSGGNVQVTQTSGVTQSVFYVYQKIGT